MSNQLTVGIENSTVSTNPVFTSPGSPPGQTFYVHAIADVPGVVAANNFMSVFNPIASGKQIIAYQATTLPWAGAATTTSVSMNVFRVTAASAGTLVAASAVNRFVTTQANPVAEVRTGNPTTTIVGTTLLGTPPAITTSGSGASVQGVSTIPPGAGFVMQPGEGIVFRTTAGDVDQLWNIQFIWAEQSL